LKKISAIAMLLVLVFNMGGYMLLFQYFIKQSDSIANEQISKGLYKSSELVELKIPVRMPYVEEQLEYQNICGHIEVSGNSYNYVAMKMTRDTMYVKCIANHEKTRLVSEKVIMGKEISDQPLNKKNHLPVMKKSEIAPDYNYSSFDYKISVPEIPFNNVFCKTTPQILHTYLSKPIQPPDHQGNIV
jgi:hypothetical protein